MADHQVSDDASAVLCCIDRSRLRRGPDPQVSHLLAAGPSERTAPDRTSQVANACVLLSDVEIEEAVGNPVLRGEEFAGPEVCRWGTEQPQLVSVLLMVRLPGSLREQILCSDLRQGGGTGERLEGVAGVALWRFGSVLSLFKSGELETCGAKGYISLSLDGERDEPALKAAALALFRAVEGRV